MKKNTLSNSLFGIIFAAILLCAGSVQAANFAYLTAKNRLSHGRQLAGAFSSEDKLELFSEDDFDALSGRLGDFDAIALQIYFENIPWQKHIDAWKDYLQNGGAILAIGCESGNVNETFMSLLGEDWAVSRENCIIASDFQRILEFRFLGENEESTFPTDIRPSMKASNGWAHFTKVGDAWDIVAVCPEDKPQIISRSYGKGRVILALPTIEGAPDKTMWRDYLLNVALCSKLHNSNISVEEFFIPVSFGENCLHARFKTNGQLNVECRIALNGKEIASVPSAVLEDGLLEVPYAIAEEGTLDVALSFGKDREFSFKHQVVVPAKLERGLYSYRPSILKQAPFALRLDPALKGKVSLELLIDGKKLQNVSFNEFPKATLADISELPPGEHKAILRVYDSSKNILFEQKPFDVLVDERDPKLTVDAQGYITRLGKRIMPIGFYFQTPHCQELMDMGISMTGVTYWASGKPPEIRKQMDELLEEAIQQQWLVKVCGSPDIMKSCAGRLAEENLVLEFGDEPDHYGSTPESVRDKVFGLKRDINRYAATYVVLSKPQSLKGAYTVSSDFIAHDPYPVSRGLIETVYPLMLGLNRSLDGWGRAAMVVPQCFGYDKLPKSWWPRVPTPTEMYNMYFQGLAAGAKGFLFYTWDDNRFSDKKTGFTLLDYPEQFNAVSKFVKWLRANEDYLLNGSWRPVETGMEKFYGASWFKEGAALEIWINASNTNLEYKEMAFAPLEVKVLENGVEVFFSK